MENQEIFNLANTPLVNQRNRNGETPFMLAVKQSNSLVVNAIGQSEYFDLNTVNQTDSSGYLPIYYAITRKYEAMIDVLKQYGVDFHLQDDYGHTASYYVFDKITIDPTILRSSMDLYIGVNWDEYNDLSEQKKNYAIATGFSPMQFS